MLGAAEWPVTDGPDDCWLASAGTNNIWGLGAHGSLQELQQHLGLDFRTRTLQEHALWGGLKAAVFSGALAGNG